MTRNLKALGLALVVAFAFSAVVASAASAQLAKITSSGPVTLKGTETGATLDNSFTAFNQVLHCPESHYTGHKFNVTPHELIPSGNTEGITVTPSYTNCVDQNNDPLAVVMNGCDYVFKDGTTVNPNENTYSILVDIVCPAGKQIEVTGGFCTVRVPPQTNKAGIHVKNTPAGPTTEDDLDVTGTITVTATACGGLLHTNSAVQHVDATMKGYNSSGVETGVTISD